MKINSVFRAASLLVLLSMVMASASPVLAAPPNGVDHLRGRWDGIVQSLLGEDQSFVLLLDESGPDPDDAQARLYNGCMTFGRDGVYAPISARVMPLGNENYDLILFGTAGGGVIKFTGTVVTGGPSVKDDSTNGVWQTADGSGDWFAQHHDRREPKCPTLNLGSDLWFQGDTYAAIGFSSDGGRNETTILESMTNIVSSGVRVELPGGGTMVIPFFTDLFSPNVDFVSEFRFLGAPEGLPDSGGTYTFTLLDIFGQSIAGATSTDTWLACPQDAPRHVSAELGTDGIFMTWDPVTPASGFDPGGFTPLGFYQVEVFSSGGDGGYGAGGIHTASHLIPYAGFGGSAPGFPDGNDFGNGLLELPDAQLPNAWYGIDTIAFSVAVHTGGFGLECQIRSWDEQVYFEKSGETITLLP